MNSFYDLKVILSFHTAMMLFLIAYSSPLLFYCSKLLQLIDLDLQIENSLALISRYMAPCLTLAAINGLLQTLCHCQGLIRHSGYIKLTLTIVSSYIGFYAATHTDLGIKSFALYYLSLQFLTFLMNLTTFLLYSKNEVKEHLGGFGGVLKETCTSLKYLKVFVGYLWEGYLQKAGFEVCLIFVAATHQLEDVVLFIVWLNINSLLSSFSHGLSLTVKKRALYLYQRKKIRAFRNFIWWSCRSFMVIGVIICVGFLVLSHQLSKIYLEGHANHISLLRIIRLYCLAIPFSIYSPSFSSIFWILGKARKIIFWEFFIILISVLTYFLYKIYLRLEDYHKFQVYELLFAVCFYIIGSALKNFLLFFRVKWDEFAEMDVLTVCEMELQETNSRVQAVERPDGGRNREKGDGAENNYLGSPVRARGGSFDSDGENIGFGEGAYNLGVLHSRNGDGSGEEEESDEDGYEFAV